MVWNMNNSSVNGNINDCISELSNIKSIIDSMGGTSNFVPYLNKYSIIKACGTIERSFKDIIADVCVVGASQQNRNYIEKTFRESSANPNLNNITKSLSKFDSTWSSTFTAQLNTHSDSSRLKSSLTSLVQLRNNLAHGGNPTSSVDDVIDYFNDSCEIIKILDIVVA